MVTIRPKLCQLLLAHTLATLKLLPPLRGRSIGKDLVGVPVLYLSDRYLPQMEAIPWPQLSRLQWAWQLAIVLAIRSYGGPPLVICTVYDDHAAFALWNIFIRVILVMVVVIYGTLGGDHGRFNLLLLNGAVGDLGLLPLRLRWCCKTATAPLGNTLTTTDLLLLLLDSTILVHPVIILQYLLLVLVCCRWCRCCVVKELLLIACCFLLLARQVCSSEPGSRESLVVTTSVSSDQAVAFLYLGWAVDQYWDHLLVL